MSFTPPYAGAVTLLFVGSVLALGAAVVVFIAALGAGRRSVAKATVIATALSATLYFGVLLTVAASSEEKVLPAGQTKYFCEIDCHIAYSVSGVRTAKTLGEGSEAATAEGVFYIVTLRSWFDEDTISSRRSKDVPLAPNPREIFVYDAAGRSYPTSLAGQKAIVSSSVPLTHPLKPGESYETTLVFDLPAAVQHPRLLVADWLPLNALIIGHENSFGHKKTFFALVPATHTAQR